MEDALVSRSTNPRPGPTLWFRRTVPVLGRDDLERNRLRRFDSFWGEGAELRETPVSTRRSRPADGSMTDAVVGVETIVGEMGGGGVGN